MSDHDQADEPKRRKPLSPEHRAALSTSMRERWKDPDYQQRQADGYERAKPATADELRSLEALRDSPNTSPALADALTAKIDQLTAKADPDPGDG